MNQYNQNNQDNPFQNLQNNQQPPPPPNMNNTEKDTTNEEIIEAIIEEKWDELLQDLSKLAEWKNTTSNKVAVLEKQFEELKKEFDKLHNSIISKVNDYDKNITNVGAELKAMEKTFSKVLPLFTENVSELAKITQELRKNPQTKEKK